MTLEQFLPSKSSMGKKSITTVCPKMYRKYVLKQIQYRFAEKFGTLSNIEGLSKFSLFLDRGKERIKTY